MFDSYVNRMSNLPTLNVCLITIISYLLPYECVGHGAVITSDCSAVFHPRHMHCAIACIMYVQSRSVVLHQNTVRAVGHSHLARMDKNLINSVIQWKEIPFRDVILGEETYSYEQALSMNYYQLQLHSMEINALPCCKFK